MISRFSRSRKSLLAVAATIFAFTVAAEASHAQEDSPPPPINVGAPVRKVSYHGNSARGPSWQQANQTRLAAHDVPEHVAPGVIVEEGSVPYHDRVVVGNGYVDNGCADGSCGGGCGDGHCGPCGTHGHRLNYCAGLLFQNLEVYGGVASFKGPMDFGQNGNFGFQYGLNLGLPLLPDWGIGWQIGVRGVSTNLEGHQATGVFVDETREQTFTTIGIFHHATDCSPWSWGVVYDQLHDEYWDEFDFAQIRGEVGYVTHNCNEFGFMFASSTKSSEGTIGTLPPIAFEGQDQYAFYFRRHLCNDGEIRGWLGFTGDGDGIVGGDFATPISDRFAIQANFNWIIPDNDVSAAQQQQDEAWAIGVNLVWHTRPGAYGHKKSPFHALLPVADNASFMRRLIP